MESLLGRFEKERGCPTLKELHGLQVGVKRLSPLCRGSVIELDDNLGPTDGPSVPGSDHCNNAVLNGVCAGTTRAARPMWMRPKICTVLYVSVSSKLLFLQLHTPGFSGGRPDICPQDSRDVQVHMTHLVRPRKNTVTFTKLIKFRVSFGVGIGVLRVDMASSRGTATWLAPLQI